MRSCLFISVSTLDHPVPSLEPIRNLVSRIAAGRRSAVTSNPFTRYIPAMTLLLALLLSSAQAITTDRSGPTFDLALGGDLTLPPVGGGLAGLAGVNWWWGRYDHSYAIGRYWSLGVANRFDLQLGDAGMHLAPLLELRRGNDLIVVGTYTAIAAGPLVLMTSDDTAIGATGRLAVGGEFRRHRFWGATLRLEAGADYVDGAVFGTGALLLGVQFSRPGDGQGVD